MVQGATISVATHAIPGLGQVVKLQNLANVVRNYYAMIANREESLNPVVKRFLDVNTSNDGLHVALAKCLLRLDASKLFRVSEDSIADTVKVPVDDFVYDWVLEVIGGEQALGGEGAMVGSPPPWRFTDADLRELARGAEVRKGSKTYRIRDLTHGGRGRRRVLLGGVFGGALLTLASALLQ